MNNCCTFEIVKYIVNLHMFSKSIVFVSAPHALKFFILKYIVCLVPNTTTHYKPLMADYCKYLMYNNKTI